MNNLKLEVKHTGINIDKIMNYAEKVTEIHNELRKNATKKDDFLGWLNLPEKYDKREFEKIKKVADKIRQDSKV